MTDSVNIVEIVKKEVAAAVARQVEQATSNESWQSDIEQKIVSYVQARVAGRFTNVQDVPGLVELVKSQVNVLFEQGQVPGIGQYVNQQQITSAIDSAVETLVQTSIDQLTIDPAWISKIEQLTHQRMVQRLIEKISSVDINQLIVKEIDTGIERWQDRLKKDFKTNGIVDAAAQCELTITDGAVVVTNGIAGKNLLIEEQAQIQGGLTVKNLAVTGTINTDNRSWNELANTISDKTLEQLSDKWKQSLVQDVLQLARTQGIEFADISIDGRPLIADGKKLNPAVTDSNIRKLGILDKLEVAGDVKVNNTLSVIGRRVGVNTDSPEMALSVWDEEVTMLAGKLSQDTGYVGTGRRQNLTLGVNRKAVLTIDTDHLVTVPKLRIDRWQVFFNDSTPGWSGTRGDFVFNSAPKTTDPFAWVCLGGFKWQPLRSA